IINNLTEQINREKNQTTNMEPIILLEKEKSFLLPFPSNEIIHSYLNKMKVVRVDKNALVYYKSKRYSVPSKFANKTLKLEEVEGKIYIYNNLDLVRIHKIDNRALNYNEYDYKEVLRSSMPYKSNSEIDEITRINLENLDSLGR
ncbi:MAG: IS21 family transposase, partial [Candidatus Cloacimonadota bacterium]